MKVAQTDPQPLRILFIISQLGLGGAEKRLVDLVIRLKRSPHLDPHVLVLKQGGEREALLRQAEVPVTVLLRGSARFFTRIWAIGKYCRRWKPHVVYAFDHVAGLYGRIGGRIAFVPVILSSLNASYIPSRLVHYAERWLWPLVDKLVCNSEAGRRYLVQECRIPSERIAVIPNGFDVQSMACRRMALPSLREELGLKYDRPLIGMIGRLERSKDPMAFARAAAIVHGQCPEATFCIIGSGSALPVVQEFLVQQKMTDRFFLIPRRPDAPWLAREFDIGVLSSRAEGLPNVVLEYMYWSKPCVVTDVGDCGLVVQHGRTGLVVPPRNPDALASALLDLLDDPRKAKRMGELGRSRLEDHYRIERYVDDLERLLISICGAHHLDLVDEEEEKEDKKASRLSSEGQGHA